MEEEKVKCPRCGSEQITWSYWRGNYCLRCGFGWDPEKLWKIRENAKKRGLSEDETEKEIEEELDLSEKPGCSLSNIVILTVIALGIFCILFMIAFLISR